MAYYRIAQFPGRGRGLEAVRDIPQGSIIVRTPCVIVPKNEIFGTLANYVFRWEDQRAVALGDASLLNHTAPGNCEYYSDPDNILIVVKARRPIRCGEELTIDYGWKEPGFVEISGPPQSAGQGDHRLAFELAQSQRDAGHWAEAAQSYAKRAEMGGWEEEAWYARLQQARCLRTLEDEGGFLSQALAAFDRRPTRAEPLYDLARWYRERGMNAASLLFSEAGLGLPPPPGDVIFVEDYVYGAGLREEYSIGAYYSPDPARQVRGQLVCNSLALDRAAPAATRRLARANLSYYVAPAAAVMPSFVARPVGFTPPAGWRPTNPSVARWGEEIVLAQRAVNYTLTEGGDYRTVNGASIATRNFLLRLTGDLEIQAAIEILPPDDMPEPAYRLVMGFEDLRLFAWRGGLWCIACVRELTAEGWCEQVLARLDEPAPGQCRLTDWQVLRTEGPRLHEKNWMPLVEPETDRLRFLCGCDPTRLVDERARTIAHTTPAIAAEHFSGGSHAIAFDDGWLAVIHEAPGQTPRTYRHRFVWFDAAAALHRVSRPFYFQRKGIEFAAGLAWHPDGKRLLLSWGVSDGEAWIATVEAGDVRALLDETAHLPSGIVV